MMMVAVIPRCQIGYFHHHGNYLDLPSLCASGYVLCSHNVQHTRHCNHYANTHLHHHNPANAFSMLYKQLRMPRARRQVQSHATRRGERLLVWLSCSRQIPSEEAHDAQAAKPNISLYLTGLESWTPRQLPGYWEALPKFHATVGLY